MTVMYKIDELHKILSQEKKDLKPDHAYKTAEEGLLRAFYFFRWLNKKEYKDADKVVEAFLKNKIPEQQIEHYGCALLMIDCYQTDENIKRALRYINGKYKEKSGKDVIDGIEDKKTRRRILKNMYQVFLESVENLKGRQKDLKFSNLTVWISILILLATSVILVANGLYMKFLLVVLPQLAFKDTTIIFLDKYGVAIMAGIIFIIPSLIILLISRHKLIEYSLKGKIYPGETVQMEMQLNEFKKKLEEEKTKI